MNRNRNRNWAPVIAGACALLPGGNVVAQSGEENEFVMLPQVVVTANRLPEAAEATGVSMSVFTAEELEARGEVFVSDALRSVPGFSVVGNGTPGQATSVFARGLEPDHLLLTIDGRRQLPTFAGSYDFANLSLTGLERIEIVRSPSSSLYAADAIGGVVNLLTRSGRGLEEPEHEVFFEGGSFNSFHEGVSSRGAQGAFDYAVSVSQFNAEYVRPNNDFRLTTVRSALGYELNEDWYLDLKASHYNSEAGSPGLIFFPSPTDTLHRDVSSISPGLEGTIGESWKTRIYYSYDHQSQLFETAPLANPLNVQSHQVDWQNDLEVLENWTLTGGGYFQDLMMEVGNTLFPPPTFAPTLARTSANQTQLDGYLQSSLEPWDGLKIVNSARFDHFSDFEDAFTWRNNIAWEVPGSGTILRGSVSESHSIPTPQDLYFPGFNNPNLDPEEAFGWEVGLDQPLWHQRLKVGATYFRNEIDNLITFDPTPKPGFPFGRPENIDAATTEGVEASVNFAPCREFESRMTYTYLTAHNDTTGLRLLRRPRHQAAWDIIVKPVPRLTVSSGVSWFLGRDDVSGATFGRIEGEDYLLLRARVNYEINENVDVWIRGDNLTDEKYEPASGFPAPRLALFGGLRLTF